MKPQTALTTLGLAVVLSLGCAETTAPVAQGTVDDFEWRGRIAHGKQIEIKGIAGDIEALPAEGDEVVVTAIKRGPVHELPDVRIDVVGHDGGVTVCAVYPDVPGERPNECAPGDAGQLSVRDTVDGTVRVTFAVHVPAGVVFAGRTVAGDVAATDLRSDAFLSSVSGDARVTTAGIAAAQTVSGSVTAVIGEADWGRDLKFATVSGDVSVTIPPITNARVAASVTTGSISSDFPLTEITPGTAHGVIGSGGPLLELSTVAGNVSLMRHQ